MGLWKYYTEQVLSVAQNSLLQMSLLGLSPSGGWRWLLMHVNNHDTDAFLSAPHQTWWTINQPGADITVESEVVMSRCCDSVNTLSYLSALLQCLIVRIRNSPLIRHHFGDCVCLTSYWHSSQISVAHTHTHKTLRSQQVWDNWAGSEQKHFAEAFSMYKSVSLLEPGLKPSECTTTAILSIA